MSDIGRDTATPTPGRIRGGAGLRFSVMVACALVGGGIGGTGGFALAAAAPWHGGWPGQRLEHLQHMVRAALDSVGATSVQEDKVHDIVASAAVSMSDDHGEHDAMRAQVMALLRAPTVDRAAAEKLRSDAVARFDAKSKTLVGAVLDAADQLNAEQRAKLADRLESMMERRRAMEHHPGSPPEGMGHHGPDEGPDGGPDSGPDKG